MDEGRNITHYFKELMVDKQENCNISYRLKWQKGMPSWIKTRLFDYLSDLK